MASDVTESNASTTIYEIRPGDVLLGHLADRNQVVRTNQTLPLRWATVLRIHRPLSRSIFDV